MSDDPLHNTQIGNLIGQATKDTLRVYMRLLEVDGVTSKTAFEGANDLSNRIMHACTLTHPKNPALLYQTLCLILIHGILSAQQETIAGIQQQTGLSEEAIIGELLLDMQAKFEKGRREGESSDSKEAA